MITLILIIYMTNASNIQVTVPGFETVEACQKAAARYQAVGLSTLVITSEARCRAAS